MANCKFINKMVNVRPEPQPRS